MPPSRAAGPGRSSAWAKKAATRQRSQALRQCRGKADSGSSPASAPQDLGAAQGIQRAAHPSTEGGFLRGMDEGRTANTRRQISPCGALEKFCYVPTLADWASASLRS